MSNVILLGIVSFLNDLSSAIVGPLIPIFLTSVLGVGALTLGFIEGIAESVSSLLKFWFGYSSDKIRNRKGFAALGYATSALGRLLLPLAGTWVPVMSGRFIDRLGKVIRTAPRDALIAESAPAEKRGAAFGLHRMLDTAGAVTGLLIAYLALRSLGDLSTGIRTIFWWAMVPGILCVIILLVFVREPRRAESKPTAPRPKLAFSWKALPPHLRWFTIVTFIFALGNASSLFLIIKALNIGFAPATTLLLFVVHQLVQVCTSYPLSKLSDKIGRIKVLSLGYLCFGLAYLGFALATSQLAYWFLFGLYGLYLGMTEGVEKALVADLAPGELRATSQGLHATVAGSTLLFASVGAGLLWKFVGPSAPFLWSSITAFAAVIVLMIKLPSPAQKN